MDSKFHHAVSLLPGRMLIFRLDIIKFLILSFFFVSLDEQTHENKTSMEVLKLSKEMLLLGINDRNTEIRYG